MPPRAPAPPAPLPGPDVLYRLLVENVTDYAIFVLDPAGGVATWTEGAERMLGYTEAEALGMPLAVFYPAEVAAAGAPERDLRTAEAEGRCQTVAWRVRRDGSSLWASVVLTALHDEAGRLIGFGEIVRDLTERREVAERYEESRQRYRSLFENNPIAIFAFDLDGELRAANPAAEALTGFEEDDLRSLPFWALIASAGREEARALFAAAVRGEAASAETALVHSGGRRVELRITLVPSVVGGRVLGVYCIAEDITGRRRAEAERESLLLRERVARAEAEAANRAKTDFLAVVSHELKTPLHAISGYAELLRDGDAGPLSDLQLRHLERICSNGAELLQLIEAVLGYARLDSGAAAVQLERVEIGGVLREVVREVAPHAEEKGVAVEVHCDHPCLAETDPARVREALGALLSNAVKFTREHGRVEVAARREGAWIVLSVSDTGVGIEPEHLERIWEPFWQVEDPLGRAAGGTGLGLSLARRLAELLGGELQVRSTPGEGSTFTLRLPGAPR